MEIDSESVYRIREARVRDTAILVKMRLSLLNHTLAVEPQCFSVNTRISGDSSDRFHEATGARYIRIIVAETVDLHEVVGMAVCKVLLRETPEPERFARIEDVWVEPNHRRRGVCRSMVADLMGFLEARQVIRLVLDYSAGDWVAESTWRSLGFRPVLPIATSDAREVRKRLKLENVGGRFQTEPPQ